MGGETFNDPNYSATRTAQAFFARIVYLLENGVKATINGILTITGNVNVANMIPAVETGLAKDASLEYADVQAAAGDLTTFTNTFNTAATQTLVTPALGKRIRVWWWMWNTSSANLAPLNMGLRWTAAGTDILNWREVGPNVAVGSNMRAGRMRLTGGVNEALCLSMSAAQRVTVNLFYDEV
jgi:hypothetical protein